MEPIQIHQAAVNESPQLENLPGMMIFNSGGAAAAAPTNRLLLETGDYLLLENNDFLALE